MSPPPGTDNTELGYSDIIGMDQYNLNKLIMLYLENQKLEIKVNDEGTCNGLAVAFCKYATEGRQTDFIQIIQAIIKKGAALATIKRAETDIKLAETATQKAEITQKIAEAKMQFDEPTDISDSQINKFIGEVIFTFLPEVFDKRYSQDDSLGLISVSTPFKKTDPSGQVVEVQIPKPMQKIYNLGLIAKTDSWANIFEKMKANGTSWTLASLTHTVAVSVKDNQFHVYDPNERKIIVCKDGKELADHLAKKCFRLRNDIPPLDQMQITINVVAHPDKKIDFQFPNKKELVEELISQDPEYLGRTKEIDRSTYDQLTLAAIQNDTAMMKILLDLGVDYTDMALKTAAQHNRVDAISLLLEPQYRDHIKGEYGDQTETYARACKNAIEEGRIEAFRRLLDDPAVRNYVVESLQRKYIQQSYLELAAKSGNPECINQVISLIKEHNQNIDIPGLINSSKALKKAEHPGCIKLLKEQAGITEAVEDKKPQHQELKSYQPPEKSSSFIESLTPFTLVLRDILKSPIASIAKVIHKHLMIPQTEVKGSANGLDKQRQLKESLMAERDKTNEVLDEKINEEESVSKSFH